MYQVGEAAYVAACRVHKVGWSRRTRPYSGVEAPVEGHHEIQTRRVDEDGTITYTVWR